MRRPDLGFTLIELLIVVAIIAILAAIAIPNFLEAQTRAKVSRVRSDLRTTAGGLEAYAMDWNAYPPCRFDGAMLGSEASASANKRVLERLSTPVAYVNDPVVRDAFQVAYRQNGSTAALMAASKPIALDPGDPLDRDRIRTNSYIYQAWNENQRTALVRTFGETLAKGTTPRAWLLSSVGPDRTLDNLGGVLAVDYEIHGPIQLVYDPTNGTISRGSMFRFGGAILGSKPGYAAGRGLRLASEK